MVAALQRPVANTYDAVVRTRPTFPDLVVWLKGGGLADARGTLTGGSASGSVSFAGAKLPSDSEQASNDYTGGNLSYPHPGAVLHLAQGAMIVFVHADPGSLSVTRGIFDRRRSGPGSPTGGFGVHWTGSDVNFEIHDGTTFHNAKAPSGILAGSSYCIATSWGPAGMKMRINKVLLASDPYTGGIPSTQAENWLVGATGFSGVVGDRWDGRIAHVQLYKRQLSAAELDALCPFG